MGRHVGVGDGDGDAAEQLTRGVVLLLYPGHAETKEESSVDLFVSCRGAVPLPLVGTGSRVPTKPMSHVPTPRRTALGAWIPRHEIEASLETGWNWLPSEVKAAKSAEVGDGGTFGLLAQEAILRPVGEERQMLRRSTARVKAPQFTACTVQRHGLWYIQYGLGDKI
jgi:hypothetical protein